MLSSLEAKRLLQRVTFPGDDLATHRIAALLASERRSLIRNKSEHCEVAAAVEIQRTWRGHRTRRRFKEILGPLLEQIRQDSLQIEDLVIKKIFSENEAAHVIQRAWRRYSNCQIYKFYRDLIVFHGKGDPATMLRTINPKECTILDKAAGVRIRFRLGGAAFPPNIYYKIFTHHNIVDLCASSPRDYTAMSQRLSLPKDIFNKPARTLPEEDKSGWYQRKENNGWRIVPSRLFVRSDHDQVQMESNKGITDFHYSKVKRKQDIEKKRKQRKVDWMKKMYLEGVLSSAKDRDGVGAALEQLVDSTEFSGPDTTDTEDIDNLLSWTSGLNFDEYSADWQITGTTATSREILLNRETTSTQ